MGAIDNSHAEVGGYVVWKHAQYGAKAKKSKKKKSINQWERLIIPTPKWVVMLCCVVSAKVYRLAKSTQTPDTATEQMRTRSHRPCESDPTEQAKQHRANDPVERA